MNWIFTFLLTLACSNADVLVYGDSQAGGWGVGVRTALEECGANVNVITFPGFTTRELAELAYEEVDMYNYNVILFITGDNDWNADIPSMRQLIQVAHEPYYREPPLVLYATPQPPTMIGNMERAITIFPYLRHEDQYYFIRQSESSRVQARDDTMRRYLTQVAYNRAIHVDLGSLAHHYNYDMPRNPDGLHIPMHVGYDLTRHILGL